jgi:hypothetical protein
MSHLTKEEMESLEDLRYEFEKYLRDLESECLTSIRDANQIIKRYLSEQKPILDKLIGNQESLFYDPKFYLENLELEEETTND